MLSLQASYHGKEQYMDDLELKRNVESELNFEPSINAAEIGVPVKNGVVTLTGRAPSYWEKIAAERTAARVNEPM
jgi:osmotically-inducible protein OsmY